MKRKMKPFMFSKRTNLTNFIRDRSHIKKYILHSKNFSIRGMTKSRMLDRSCNLDIISYMRLSITKNILKNRIKTNWKGVSWDIIGMAQVLKGLCWSRYNPSWTSPTPIVLQQLSSCFFSLFSNFFEVQIYFSALSAKS